MPGGNQGRCHDPETTQMAGRRPSKFTAACGRMPVPLAEAKSLFDPVQASKMALEQLDLAFATHKSAGHRLGRSKVHGMARNFG